MFPTLVHLPGDQVIICGAHLSRHQKNFCIAIGTIENAIYCMFFAWLKPENRTTNKI